MPKRDKENQNPTAEARFAMCHWPDWYSSQRGGSMDFYLDVLNKKERQYCAESVREIIAAWKKHQRGGD